VRRWRSAFSSVSIIFMLFVVGTAMAPTVATTEPQGGTVELRTSRGAELRSLSPWPKDVCTPSCPEDRVEPSPDDVPERLPVTTTTTAVVPPVTTSPPAPRVVAPPPAPRPVEEWRSLVSAYFAQSDVDKALRVIWCESGGDPNAQNPSSGAAGLFQHIPRYWPDRAAAIGLAGASIFDPVANVSAAAWLVYTEGWSHWNASASCW
jgi:hypothetical protein